MKQGQTKYPPKMNKKAIEWMSTETVGIILAAFFLLFLMGTCSKLYGLFLTPKIDQATESNFNRLVDEINDLLEDESKYSTTLPYYIHEDYVLVGFDDSEIFDISYTPSPKKIERSDKCKYNSCICLAKKDKDSLNYLTCKIFEKIKTFNAKPSTAANNNFGAEKIKDGFLDLLIYGQLKSGHPRFGVKNINIEKRISSDDKFLLYIDIK